MASNYEEPMDSQDLFESSQPLPKPKFLITNGEVWDLKVRIIGNTNKGLYGQKFLTSLLTETNLAVIDLSKPNELEGKVEDEFKLAKATMKRRLQIFMSKFTASKGRWTAELKEHDIFFRLNPYWTLMSHEGKRRFTTEDDHLLSMTPTPPDSQHSVASAISSGKSLLERLHPSQLKRPKHTKPFHEYSDKTKKAKIKEFVDLGKQLAKDLKSDYIKLICFSAFSELYVSQRKLARHFETLASGLSNPEIGIETATHIKYFCKLSDSTYTNLRYLLENHVNLPTVKRVQKHATSILPEGLNWNEDIPNAVSAPVENVIKGTIQRLPPTVSQDIKSRLDISGRRYEKYIARFNSGWDGSGDQSIYNSASSLAFKNNHLFYAGVSLLDIKAKSNGEEVFKVEHPCSPRNVRPVILANAGETKEFVKIVCDHFQKAYDRFDQGPLSIEIAPGMFREFEIQLELTLLDGKGKAQASGLGGAYCLSCTTSIDDAHNPDKIREGFLMDRTMESLKENFVLLAQPDPDTGELIVKKEKDDYSTRQGLTSMPVAPNQSNLQAEIAVLHAWLRSQGLFLNLVYRTNSGVKQWRKTITKPMEQNLKHAKKVFQEGAERTMNLQIDQPGTRGGNTNTGTVAKEFFSAKNRNKVMDLFHGSVEEKEGFRQLLQNFNVILRLLSSSVKVNTPALDELCKDTQILFVQTFPWWRMSQAVHGFLSHCAERIEQNDGISLGELSEQGLESSNKELREGREKFARKMDLEKNLKDVFKRQYVDSDQILWDLKKKSVCSHCYASGHTIRKCPALKEENEKEEDEEVDEDLELLNSLMMD